MRGTYDLVKAGHDPFAQISVDEVLADILLDEVNQEENGQGNVKKVEEKKSNLLIT